METNLDKRISKHKLPKGFSYPVQTKDIVQSLDTSKLAITYSYYEKNPTRDAKSLIIRIGLLNYHKYKDALSFELDHDSILTVYSIPARLRNEFRPVLINKILPFMAEWQKHKNKNWGMEVYYECFWESLDLGGIYVRQTRDNVKPRLIYRDEKFNIDEKIQEILK